MKQLLRYHYQTKASGENEAIFTLTDANSIEIKLGDKSVRLPFEEFFDVLHHAAQELQNSPSQGVKHRALSIMAATYLTPFFQKA